VVGVGAADDALEEGLEVDVGAGRVEFRSWMGCQLLGVNWGSQAQLV